MRLSVAMATYNGIAFLEEQIDSVLSQLADGDELVVSDDGSTDGTRERLEAYAASDPRVKVIDGPQAGVIKNFERAIAACEGDVIALCDQDDVWAEDKREALCTAFADERTGLVMHDALVTDGDGAVVAPSFFSLRNSRTGFWKNVWKNCYIGCCMAFRRTLCERVLPFPDSIPMHDQWIGLQAEKQGRVVLLERPLLCYRRHGGNATGDGHGSLLTMLRQRAGLLKAMVFKR